MRRSFRRLTTHLSTRTPVRRPQTFAEKTTALLLIDDEKTAPFGESKDAVDITHVSSQMLN